ncbi:MAG TPA: MFS transporter, partial [Candidatus Limnocylindria bacterium]
MAATAAPTTSYRALLHVPGFPRLAVATLLVRAGASMWQLALVLFVLQRYGSASLAGISVFLAIAPGVIVSPLAGALLDRYGRVRLMVSDYAASAIAL